jgi:hypothetical protein
MYVMRKGVPHIVRTTIGKTSFRMARFVGLWRTSKVLLIYMDKK